MKRAQRDRAALSPDSKDFDYLKNEVARRLADRINVRIRRPLLSLYRDSHCYG